MLSLLNMNTLQNELTFAKNLALEAGKIILDNFSLSFDAKIKDDLSPVTVIDERVNQLVIDQVKKSFPEHSVLGEEQNNILESNYTWTCDPIDGTIPFTMGIPVSVFGLALLLNGTPVLGVVYDPFMKRLYSAVKNGGSFLNDIPIRVNNNPLSSQSRINLDWWPQAEFNTYEPIIKLQKKYGCYAFAPGSAIHSGVLVARGQFTLSVFSGSKGKFVDIAPLKIIVEEAGGKVTNLFGKEQRYDQDIMGAIVSNSVVHQQVVEVLAEYL